MEIVRYHNPEYFYDKRKIISKKRAAFSKKKCAFEKECKKELVGILRQANRNLEKFFNNAGFTLHDGADTVKRGNAFFNKNIKVFNHTETHMAFMVEIKDQIQKNEYAFIKIRFIYIMDDRKYVCFEQFVKNSYMLTTTMAYQYSKETLAMFYERVMRNINKLKDIAYKSALEMFPNYMEKTVRHLKLQKINAI